MREMYPKNGHVILHVDMNCFFASVEIAHDPLLKGKPLAIAGNEKERKGIIVTCSYEAREYGIRTTMQLWEAKKLCPHLIVKQPNFTLYREASFQMFQILSRFTEKIQPVSIDEGYLDITDCYALGTPIEIAKMIQKTLVTELQLPCSIGIAPNLFLAKTASDMQKPLGITVLRKRDIPYMLWPRSVESMHGIGKKTAEKLNEIHIYTIEQLAKGDEHIIRAKLGKHGVDLQKRAKGIDDRKVDPNQMGQHKSVGNSMTFSKDMDEEKELLDMLKKLSKSVSSRLQKRTLVSYNIQIIIKYYDRRTITRSKQLKNAVWEERDIFQAASRLWKQHWNGDSIRLLGVTATELEWKTESVKQLDLFSFEQDAKEEPLLAVIEQINDKYGTPLLQRGSQLLRKQEKSFQQRLENKFL
ncbi:DNA polymerase IV [Bacillus cytotoxicus]|uniref:DNA polymerase IV n=1 Tax=Bacillus cytotoxicus TaxID=580165 RepID=UPI0008645E7B|nr:DNA polymerase IV [Bacillus cytotoxicus]AWC29724.1 DNA polymerase IV [Bacillus cytotoxicus]AWC41855.1 DNA polymerase IV [Bacillus cytotoxicus]AWC49786.1 DNA polymerase IV [Bacillus cytotoxicus]AWC53801.1 DNA polymerase IV [Bacillus cytotoxicus]AWC57927.1 DNA polymerase IV [Bacillus cytotoxicus]